MPMYYFFSIIKLKYRQDTNVKIRNKSILALVLLGILDNISVFFPITALLGIYVVCKQSE